MPPNMSYKPKYPNLSEQDRAFAFAVEKLGQADDHGILIINAHLLFESVVNTFVRRQLHHPRPFIDAKLSGTQLYGLAQSMLKTDRQPWIWEFLERVTLRRNRVAHLLHADECDQDLHDLLAFARPHLKLGAREGLTQDLRMTLLLGFVTIRNALLVNDE